MVGVEPDSSTFPLPFSLSLFHSSLSLCRIVSTMIHWIPSLERGPFEYTTSPSPISEELDSFFFRSKDFRLWIEYIQHRSFPFENFRIKLLPCRGAF